MMQRHIYIHCDGGLGNRFNCLVGGLYLAHQFELVPQIMWPINNWCAASMEEVFTSKILPTPITYDQVFDTFDTLNLFRDNQYHRSLSFMHPDQISTLDACANVLQTESHKHVFYANSLIPTWMHRVLILQLINSHLLFNPELTTKAEQIMQTHTSDTPFWGIHLRKTDFGSNAVNDSTYESWIQANADQKVFVCSDDPECEHKFAKLPNVFIHDKCAHVKKLIPGEWTQLITDQNNMQWPFNVDRSSESVKQAVVDVWILSHSKLVNTNMNSTFLLLAHMLQQARATISG